MARIGEEPLAKLQTWISEEQLLGVPFAHGAVLGTVGLDGAPRTRMLGAYLSNEGIPIFYTSPASQKVSEIEKLSRASLTFGFQRGLRSVTIEGTLEPLSTTELNEGWRGFDADFRKHYVIFGPSSGASIDSFDHLRDARDRLAPGAEDPRPESFIGFRFKEIHRVIFYAVAPNDFAVCEEFKPLPAGGWVRQLRVP